MLSPAVIDGARAKVASKNKSAFGYFGYQLQQQGNDWRIVSVRRYFSDEDAVIVDEKKRAEVLGRADEHAPFLPLGDDPGPHPALFAPNRTHTLPGNPAGAPATTLSTFLLPADDLLALPSGVVGVEDFGYGNDFFPLHRRVPPGRYPVEASIVTVNGDLAHERVAGVRVLFSKNAVARFHPANIKDSGHVIGVDAGNVTIFDGGNYVALRQWTKEDLYNDAIDRLLVRPITMRDRGDAVMVASGWGDGGYPKVLGRRQRRGDCRARRRLPRLAALTLHPGGSATRGAARARATVASRAQQHSSKLEAAHAA